MKLLRPRADRVVDWRGITVLLTLVALFQVVAALEALPFLRAMLEATP
jgi:hypothetical protein